MKHLCSLLYLLLLALPLSGKERTIKPGALWPDAAGNHINAHGGGVLFYKGYYYWYGEHKAEHTSAALVGVAPSYFGVVP